MVDNCVILVPLMTQRLSPGLARHLLKDWDGIQLRQDQYRLSRIDLMIDVLDAKMLSRFTVLDLGAGPGSVSRRILERIPRARVIALDVHPSFVLIGERALSAYRDRCRWMNADFRKRDWDAPLGAEPIDAVFSHAALHGLRSAEMGRLYRTLACHLPRGGVVLNGDRVPWHHRQRALNDLANGIREFRTRRGVRSSQHEFADNFARWWTQTREVTELRESNNRWKARAKNGKPVDGEVDFETHLRLLHEADFREATTVWQNLDVRVILAIK